MNLKLNLGCGTKIRKDFINIDIRKLPGVDLIHDLKNPLPYKDNTVDRIVAWDVLEHFPWRQTDTIFNDWVRVLKKGGKILLSLPNFEVHLEYLQKGITDSKKRYNTPWEFFIANVFGGQDYPENTHYRTFTPDSVKDFFKKHNLKIIFMELRHRAIVVEGEKL